MAQDIIDSPLITMHYNEIQFNLRLFHLPTKKYVGNSGLTKHISDALYYTCGAEGESLESIYTFFINDAQISWMSEYPMDEFEIHSSLAKW